MELFEGDRAVSDVLGFIVVFSIIITSVALVYGTGFSSLEQVREGEQKANAERAFEAISLSMDDIVSGAAPRRGGSLNLGGGLLQVEDSSTPTPTTVTVNVDGSVEADKEVGTFAYTLDKTTIAYENGGVFRSDRDASVAVQRASMTCTEDRAIVSLVVLESSSNPIDSDGSVEITMEEKRSSVLYTDDDGNAENDVTVSVSDTEFQNGWDQAMDSSGWTEASGDYECNDKERVIVRLTVIEVTFRSP